MSPDKVYNKPIDLEETDGTAMVSDLPDAISERPHLRSLSEVEIPDALKPPAEEDDLEHRQFDEGTFWKKIPAFKNVSEYEFKDWMFQNKNSITRVKDLKELLKGVAPDEFLEDVERGMVLAPMALRLSPYMLSLIDWDDPYNDPLRTQFIPVASTREKDHPMLRLDSLCEEGDSPVNGLVHRYPDKVLFLPLDVCPVYCRFCTRSYAIGGDTDTVEKSSYKLNSKRWESAFAYIASRPEIEDVVVSGGDAFMLTPAKLRQIGEILLDIPHVRRIRLATKGPAVMPMKIISHHEWRNALVDLVILGRRRCKEVCLHTHFNSINEISEITSEAMNMLFREGVKVRNQSVLIRGVNDDHDHMVRLVRQLAYMNVQPYYVYQHDMVKGVEELRTRVGTTQEIERNVRGATAGFNTPVFVNDVPGGGGKRDIHSYDHYDTTTGVSVYRSPHVTDHGVFLYFDPLSGLPEEGRERWETDGEHEAIIKEAIRDAGYEGYDYIR